MIQISVTDLLVLYVIIGGAIVMLVWFAADQRRKRRDRIISRKKLLCDLCGHRFRDISNEASPPCPQCGRNISRTSGADL